MVGKPQSEVWLVLPWSPDHQGGVTGVVQHLKNAWPDSDAVQPRLVVNDWSARITTVQQGVRQVRFALLVGDSWASLLRSAFQAPCGLFRLWRVLALQRVVAVNFHYTDQAPAGVALLKWLGAYRGRLVISYHGTDVRVPDSRVERWLQRLCLAQADALVACAESLAQRAATTFKIPRQRLTVIRNGVDVQRFSPRAALSPEMAERLPSKYIVSVGSFIPRKAPEIILAAFAELAADHLDLHLCIAGPDGPLREQIRAQAADLGLSHRVHLLVGLTPDQVAGLLARAVLCVQPALAESMPLAVLEAGAVGVPLLVSDIPGHDELVEHGRTGHLFTAGSGHACAVAICVALSDLHGAKSMADTLREHVISELTWSNCLARYCRQFGIDS